MKNETTATSKDAEPEVEDRYTAEELLDAINELNIVWNTIGHTRDPLSNPRIEFRNSDTDLIYCTYPWTDRNSLIDGLSFIIDITKNART